MPQAKNQIGCLVRRGTAGGDGAARQVDAGHRVGRTGARQSVMFSEVVMKVVLIDNPKFFSGILRKLFGIKKLKPTA